MKIFLLVATNLLLAGNSYTLQHSQIHITSLTTAHQIVDEQISVVIENVLGTVIRVPQLFPANRIVGGKETLIQNYPFVVSLVIKLNKNQTVFSGGGAIIGKDWAITAAHCVFDFNDGIVSFQRAFVRSNTSYWKDDPDNSRDHLIIDYVVHELYEREAEDYDIALLHVQEPFDGQFEKSIRYATKSYEYIVDKKATTLGWGTTEPGVEPYTVRELREVQISLVEEKRCIQVYNIHNVTITIRMMCATDSGKDACINDSGGPLVQYDGDTKNLILIGIVSWGIECASNEFPGVYTKVSEFDKWIQDTMHSHIQDDNVQDVAVHDI